MDRSVGHRRERALVRRSRARHVQPGQRAPVLGGLHRALPRRAGRAQRSHHRVGEGGDRDVSRPRGAYDRTFNIYRVWADLRFLDLAIDPSDRTVGCYFGDPKRANYGPWGIGAVSTCRSWLSMWSLAESKCRGAPNLARVSCPALVVQSTADQGCYPSDARDDLRRSGVRPTSGSSSCPATTTSCDPPDGRDSVADLIADWLRSHAT